MQEESKKITLDRITLIATLVGLASAVIGGISYGTTALNQIESNQQAIQALEKKYFAAEGEDINLLNSIQEKQADFDKRISKNELSMEQQDSRLVEINAKMDKMLEVQGKIQINQAKMATLLEAEEKK